MVTAPLVRAGTTEVGTVRAGTVVVVTPVDGNSGMIGARLWCGIYT